MRHDSKRPKPETEDDLDYCPKCGEELQTIEEEWMPTRIECPEHGSVTIDFQPVGRGAKYAEFNGKIRSPEWIRCPACSHIGVEIPEGADWENVYFECPECGQEGIVS